MASRRMTVSCAYPRREARARNATRIDRRSLILVVGLLTLTAFAGVLYLSQAGVAAELRYRLSVTEGEAQGVWENNLALQKEIADLGRLQSVEERAAHLGMIPAPSTAVYIAYTVPNAQLASTSRPLAEAPSAMVQPAAGDAWGQLAQRLGWAAGRGTSGTANR